MRALIICIIITHGVIHFMGFVKAFKLAKTPQLTQQIPKTQGIFWAMTGLLFIATAVLYYANINWWLATAVIAILFSQILIFNAWQDAKYGQLVNLFILVVALTGYAGWKFENGFHSEVKNHLKQTNWSRSEVITESDLHTSTTCTKILEIHRST